MKKFSPGTKLCPSSTSHEGALLLGVVQGDQTVALLNTDLTVDASFVAKAEAEGFPEKRFRFAGKCVKSGCKQWTGTKCGVIKEFSEYNPHLDNMEFPLPDCIIRNRCRWFSQEGNKACIICPYVITDNLLQS